MFNNNVMKTKSLSPNLEFESQQYPFSLQTNIIVKDSKKKESPVSFMTLRNDTPVSWEFMKHSINN